MWKSKQADNRAGGSELCTHVCTNEPVLQDCPGDRGHCVNSSCCPCWCWCFIRDDDNSRNNHNTIIADDEDPTEHARPFLRKSTPARLDEQCVDCTDVQAFSGCSFKDISTASI